MFCENLGPEALDKPRARKSSVSLKGSPSGRPRRLFSPAMFGRTSANLGATVKMRLSGLLARTWKMGRGIDCPRGVRLFGYASSAICGIADEAGNHAILIMNGGGIFVRASVSITTGVLVSNGRSVTDQAGLFTEGAFSTGYGLLGGGSSTASGTTSTGQGINTTIGLIGAGVGTPSLSFGQSTTTERTPGSSSSIRVSSHSTRSHTVLRSSQDLCLDIPFRSVG
jgi:hypothetical protein